MSSYLHLYFYISTVFCVPSWVLPNMIQTLTVAAMLHLVLPELTDVQTYTHILLSTYKIAFGLASIGRVPYFLDILAKKART